MGRLINRIPELFQRKGIRDKKRYLQKDMALGCGLSGNAISRLMRYETLDNVPFSHIVAVAKWLEVHAEELAYDEAEGV
jgi:transcriptional regulator with XRE-family HTH domain